MGPHTAACWGRKRDRPKERQPASAYFKETIEGTHCLSNWYHGNFGFQNGPRFTGPAPALLGFDEAIADFW